MTMLRVFKPKRLEEAENRNQLSKNLPEIIQFMVKEIKLTYQTDKVNLNVKKFAARKILQAYPSLEAIGV